MLILLFIPDCHFFFYRSNSFKKFYWEDGSLVDVALFPSFPADPTYNFGHFGFSGLNAHAIERKMWFICQYKN